MKRNGFTLIEVLVVIAILSAALTVLYASFQVGLRAYSRLESELTVERESDVFFLQFSKELRNAFPYLKAPFQGGPRFVSFPATIVHYTPQGTTKDLCLVEYRWDGNSLIRKERRLKKDTLKSEPENRETVLDGLSGGSFSFLYITSDRKLTWKKEWLNQPYAGLPRGVRIVLKSDRFVPDTKTFEILIPQGVLLEGAAS